MGDNAAAFRRLDDWIGELRATRGTGKVMAAELAPLIKAEGDKAIAAGQGLDGVKWAPTKAGTPPLEHAAEAFSVKADGSTIFLTVSRWEVFHQYGTGHVPARPILPVHGMPSALGRVVKNALVKIGLPFMSKSGGRRLARIDSGAP